MADLEAQERSGWTLAVRQRRRGLLQRLGIGVAAALIFSPLVGWAVASFWLFAYFLIQFFELMVFGPINAGQRSVGVIRNLAGCAVLTLNALFFGSLSLPLWIAGGSVGGVCATILLSAAAIYAVINSAGSARVLACTLAPQLLYLGAGPFFLTLYGGSQEYVAAAAIAVIVFATYCVSVWRRMEQSSRAESAARREAERKQAEAESAMAGRTAFLASVGHDLRTPISAILTGAAELEKGDAQARAHAGLITDAGLMMKALLDDLLDHSKLDAGRMTVVAEEFDPRGLIAQSIRLWHGAARAKGLKLRLEGASRLPRSLKGDPMRLRQVLNNLISNAMKFTEAGSITLRLNAWPEEPTSYALLIEVADTGPGMRPDQLARLFTPFDQTDDGISARHGGTGLGLAISKDLVELMGGRLTVRSAPGEGAAFTISLQLPEGVAKPARGLSNLSESRDAVARTLRRAPAAPAPAPAGDGARSAKLAPAGALPADIGAEADAGVETEAETGEQDRPLKVLVVDDHEINRRAVQLILQPLGCDIATAADGMAALEACRQTTFDVIFMDVRMPELDGRETTRRLRADQGQNAATPVIAVTADTAAEDIAACTAAGMDYFVSKPLTPPTLLGALQHVLSAAAQSEADVQSVAA